MRLSLFSVPDHRSSGAEQVRFVRRRRSASRAAGWRRAGSVQSGHCNLPSEPTDHEQPFHPARRPQSLVAFCQQLRARVPCLRGLAGQHQLVALPALVGGPDRRGGYWPQPAAFQLDLYRDRARTRRGAPAHEGAAAAGTAAAQHTDRQVVRQGPRLGWQVKGKEAVDISIDEHGVRITPRDAARRSGTASVGRL